LEESITCPRERTEDECRQRRNRIDDDDGRRVAGFAGFARAAGARDPGPGARIDARVDGASGIVVILPRASE